MKQQISVILLVFSLFVAANAVEVAPNNVVEDVQLKMSRNSRRTGTRRMLKKGKSK